MDTFLPAIAVPLILALLKWSMPHRERVDIDELKLAQNAKKYNRYELLSLIPLFIYIPLVAYLFYLLGTTFFSTTNKEEGVVLFYAADAMIWPVVGLCFAFGTIMLPMNKLYEFLLKEEFDLYIEYTNRKHGFDGFKVWRPFSYLMIILGGVTMCLAKNAYFKVTENKVVVNHFFSMQPVETHFYEIGRIVLYQKAKAPNGNVFNNEHYVIYGKNDKIVLDESFKFFELKESTIHHLLEKCKLTLEKQDLRMDKT